MGTLVDDQGNSTENKADIIVRKWRDGEANIHIPVRFDGPRMKFIFGSAQTRLSIQPEVISTIEPRKQFLDEDENPF
jgi:hypothetical protein